MNEIRFVILTGGHSSKYLNQIKQLFKNAGLYSQDTDTAVKGLALWTRQMQVP